MAIIERHIASQGLGPAVLNVLDPIFLGPLKASAIAAVFTKQTFASTINATSAVGTQPDFPRALLYQMSLTNGTASSAMVSGGTFVVDGFDAAGRNLRETLAFTSAAAQSTTFNGTAIFASLKTDGVSFSNFSLATASSSASASVSFSVGVGNIAGLPLPVPAAGTVAGDNGRAAAVPYMFLGTSAFTNYTVVTGAIGAAGVSVAPTLGSGTNLFAVVDWNAVTQAGT